MGFVRMIGKPGSVRFRLCCNEGSADGKHHIDSGLLRGSISHIHSIGGSAENV
jgi:hypothetical protein